MTVHIFKCPECGIQYEWDKFPPINCKQCGAVFDFTRDCDIFNEEIQQTPSNYRLKEPQSIIQTEDISTIYDINSFRILGIESNATRKTIRDCQQSLKARAKLGGPISISDALGFLKKILRDEISIRNAVNQIEMPKTRISERLFWFYNINEKDSEALDKLKNGMYNDAVHLWHTSDELSALINITILYHAYYIKKDIGVANTEKWQRVFERWQNLINKEEYWIFLEKIEKESGFEPLATSDDFDTLKNDIWTMILKPNVDCIKRAIELNLDDVAQHHLELIRSSNFPSKTVTDIEFEIFSPLEEKINEEINNLLKVVFNNKNNSSSISEKKSELDRALDLFKISISKKINRFLKLVGDNPDISKNMRQKTATCLREIAISYNNEIKDYDTSELILKEIKKFTTDIRLLATIEDDLGIISKSAQESHELEKFAEYNDTIGNEKLVITKDLIVFKKCRFWINEISGIRYGIYQSSVNGIPTSRSYGIWIKRGSQFSQDVMNIECADSTWFGEEKIKNRFDEIVNRLYLLVQVPHVEKMIADFRTGKRFYISNLAIDFTGIYKDFSYDPLSKGIISLSSKIFGTKDIIIKEGRGKHLSWDNYRGYNYSDGKLWIFGESGNWISLSLRDDWNAVNLGIFLKYISEDENLVKDIENCISGSAAVDDNKSEIINTLDKSLEIDPKNWLTWWQKGRALRNLGKFEESLAAFNEVIEIKPKDPEVWNIKGLILLDAKKEEEALDCFEKALIINSNLDHVWYNKGMTFDRLKKYKEAVRAIDRSLAIKFDQDIKNTRDRIHSLIKE